MEERDAADIRDERRALLDLTAGRHQRRYARTRSLQRRARELTTALLRAELSPRPARPPEPPMEDMDHDDDERRDGRRWWDR